MNTMSFNSQNMVWMDFLKDAPKKNDVKSHYQKNYKCNKNIHPCIHNNFYTLFTHLICDYKVHFTYSNT